MSQLTLELNGKGTPFALCRQGLRRKGIEMLKQLVIKIAIALTLLATLLGGGAALSAPATAAKATAGSDLACAEIFYPPC